ncbi:hypothetical protein AMC87_CH00096 [Rhizobium phaseoli]|uniref:hypothetical protein n=1 Tax=Rhizobium phaseoli TaxID=396 RepID=UPI0007E9D931|nr:hypothetical protein [Rhizobium phaseoli]ANL44847.1 hypothetical protein AMC87_CH00096 [Rhizobium phaseoli]
MLAFVWKPVAIRPAIPDRVLEPLCVEEALLLARLYKQTRIDLADGAYPAVFQVPKVAACGCRGLTTVAPSAISLLSF